MDRSDDWLNQAEKDLSAAEDSMASLHYEWSCFQSQQAAEKAFKALLMSLKIDAWGHGILHLYKKWQRIQKDQEKLEQEISEDLDEDTDDEPEAEEISPVGAESGNDIDPSIPEIPEEDMQLMCQELDRHYTQPRYPNGFASGYPAEYYNKKIAQESLTYATAIVEFVKARVVPVSPSE